MVKWLLNSNLSPCSYLSKHVSNCQPRKSALNCIFCQCGTLLLHFEHRVNQQNFSLLCDKFLLVIAGAFRQLGELNWEQRYSCRHRHIHTEYFYLDRLTFSDLWKNSESLGGNIKMLCLH